MLSITTGLTALAIDTSLPGFDDLRADFGLEPGASGPSWTITMFFLGMSVGQMIWGPLSDRLGRRRVLHVGLFAYALCGIAAALAPDLSSLLVARFLWGVAAAGPRVVGIAVVRDLFAGDEMASVASGIQAVFMITPVLAPGLGELLLAVGTWRWTYGICVVLALVGVVWFRRLPETLPADRRRPLSLAETGAGIRDVFTTRATLLYALASMLGYAAFLPWLGSSELMFGEIYGRESQFAAWFALGAVVMAVTLTVSGRIVGRVGSRRLALVFLAGSVASGLALGLLGDRAAGVGFAAFLVLATAANAFQTGANPTLIALAMEPMGHRAGAASAIIGTMATAGGALLASQIDARIIDSVAPFGWGMAIFGVLAIGCVVLAGRPASTEASV